MNYKSEIGEDSKGIAYLIETLEKGVYKCLNSGRLEAGQ